MDRAYRVPDPAMLQRAALAYAKRGWQVLPLWWPAATRCACGITECDSIGKHPIRHLVPHGLHDAVSNPRTVTGWWHALPYANVGIRTGAESGLIVLDVDGQAGRLALRDVVAACGRFHARWARTGSGGWHAYFAHPGTGVPNSAGRLGDGLDVRGDGGYVVAPPSLHGCRRPYRWASRSNQITAAGHLPPVPAWLVELAASTSPAPADPHQASSPVGNVAAYGPAALAREAGDVARAPTGQRNHRLNRAAFKIGQLVGAGLVDETAAVDALVAAGLTAGPGERKIRSTVQRGLLAGMRHPRHVVPASLPGPPATPVR